MRIRCPHCQHLIELIEGTPLTEIQCGSCDSRFNLLADETQTAGRSGGTAEPDDGTERVGRFALEAVLGMGAFGTVWRARDTELDRTVAIKIPRSEQIPPERIEAFVREARAAAQLNHPHIVGVHEVGRDGGLVYIVSDLIDGTNLAHRMSEDRFSAREAAELAATIADALEHAHRAGVVHRDLKPANVLLDVDGRPYVTDFGLAKRETGEITMTISGTILGTPAYMSPEQAGGASHDADARSDVYSLGVILFEFLTGERPFRGNTRMLLQQVLHDDAPLPRSLNHAVPRDLETICLRCLEKDPSRRYRSAAELRDELRRYLAGEPIHARPIGRLERSWRWCRRHPAAAGALLATVALLVTSTAAAVWINAERSEAVEQRNTAENRGLEIARQNEEIARQKSAVEHQRSLVETERNDAIAARDEARREAERARHAAFNAELSQVEGLADTDSTIALRRLLDEQRFPRDLRGLAWRLLHQRCRRREHLFEISKDSARYDVSSDGKLVAIADYKGWLSLRSLETGRELWRQKVSENRLGPVAFLPGEHRFAFAQETTISFRDEAEPKPDEVFSGLFGHTGRIDSLCWSPDGSTLVSGGLDGVRVWDAKELKERRLLKTAESLVWGLAISPDGSTIAASSGRPVYLGTDPRSFEPRPGVFVQLWKLEDGEAVATFEQPDSRRLPADLAFSPDGRLVASADGYLTVWDVRTGRAVIDDTTVAPRHVRFTMDGRLLASGDGQLTVWNVSLGRIESRFRGAGGFVFVESDGRHALTLGEQVVRWRLEPGLRGTVLHGHAGAGDNVECLVYAPDGSSLASGGPDGLVRLHDPKTHVELATLRHHDGAVLSLAISLDGRRLVSSAMDGQVCVWDTGKMRLERVFDGSTGRVVENEEDVPMPEEPAPDPARAPGDEAEDGGNPQDRGAGLPLHPGEFRGIHSIALSDDGERIAFTRSDGPGGPVFVHDVESGERLHTFEGHGRSRPVSAMTFTRDGRYLVTHGGLRQSLIRGVKAERSLLKTWDLQSGKEIPMPRPHADTVFALRLDPAGTTLAAVSADSTISLHDVDTTENVGLVLAERKRLRVNWDGFNNRYVMDAAFTSDGHTLASVARDGHLRLWDPLTGHLQLTLRCDPTGALAVAVRPDGRQIATSGYDGTIRLWDAPLINVLEPDEEVER